MLGKVIGNYLITGELARGGMGAVYRGRHQALPREVVVKSILLSSFPPQTQEQLKARFVREAYVQSQLDHPNIVRVFEFFTSTENYYLVMEFVNGMSLRDLIKRQGALPPHQALPLFKQALSALDYAHSFSYVDESGRRLKGIIHRDIKPANLLLDGMARLKMTDFGIVKLAGESSMTRTGFNPGTVEYMSPEQIRGLEVDARSDIYSLGITFYEMLAGRVPFPHSEKTSEYEVFKGHIEIAPPPLTEFRADVPASLSALVMRALEKNPEDRFPSAAEFLNALLAYEQGVPVGSVAVRADSIPQQLTHSMTEQLGAPTQPAPLTAESGPAIPTDPNNNRRQVQAVSAISDSYQTTLARPQPKRSGLLMVASSVLLLALVAAGAAYFFWPQRAPASNTPSAANAVEVAPSPVVAHQEDERLKRARELEQQENYVEAIKLYNEYLQANVQASDASSTSARVVELKKLQGLLTVAGLEMSRQDYAAAKRDFAEALKLRPQSKRAQNGLNEADALLTAR